MLVAICYMQINTLRQWIKVNQWIDSFSPYIQCMHAVNCACTTAGACDP